jgi:Holliday junction resolvase RusA-like endonuclease
VSEITFTVFGDPIALKRHRTVLTAAGVRQYDPSAADKSDFLAQAMAAKPDEPLTGPLAVHCVFSFGRPKNHFSKKGLKNNAPYHKQSRPDLDNLVKFVLDAINGKFFIDDAQVVMQTAEKCYGNVPAVIVTIQDLSILYCVPKLSEIDQ